MAIAASTYALAILATRSSRWPLFKPLLGAVVTIVAGLVYTAFDEWLNVYQRGSWAYTESMPQISGIGVTPLLQWVLIPPACAYLVMRNRGKPDPSMQEHG